MDRGEVWLLNLDPTMGAETKKTRPVVILNSNALGILPLRVIVPITERKDQYAAADWMVAIPPDLANGLQKQSCADCFQIRSVSTGRFVKKLGSLNPDELNKIARALGLVVEMPG